MIAPTISTTTTSTALSATVRTNRQRYRTHRYNTNRARERIPVSPQSSDPHGLSSYILFLVQSLQAANGEAAGKSFGQKLFEGYEKTANVATTLFPLWTVLFTGLALKSPSSFAWFTTEYFTAGLAALMLSMGITLTPNDFKKVAARPNATLMQFALCYGMMPMLALGLGKAFALEPALIAGMVLVGSINGGQASNLCTYIARGNVALSVLMTTATTLGAIVMTPLLCKSLLGAVVPVDAAGIAKSTIQVRSSLSA
jgi:BASS family bile acid:Na+ symporter